MRGRLLLSLINLAVAATALLVWFTLPQYAEYALWVFLAWIVVGFSTIWLRWGTPTAAGAAGPSAPGAGGAAARPAAGSPGVGFCIYCGADLPTGATRCPTCGHADARLT